MKNFGIKLSMVVLTAALATSCATTHPGEIGKSVGNNPIPGLTISVENIESNKNEPFQIVEVTFENTSDDWIRINRTDLYVANPAETKISAVVGSDLKYWAEAKRNKIKKDQYNTELAKSALILGGTAAMGSSDNNVAIAGALVTIGTAAWVVADAINHDLNNATQSQKFPEYHAFNPAAVPGKSFIRRWLVVNRPSAVTLNNIVLEVETIDGKKDFVSVKL